MTVYKQFSLAIESALYLLTFLWECKRENE